MNVTPKVLVESVLKEIKDRIAVLTESDYRDTYDRFIDFAEGKGEGSPEMALANFVAEVRNGGFEQYVLNGVYEREFGTLQDYLHRLGGPEARALYLMLLTLAPTLEEMKDNEDELPGEEPFGSEMQAESVEGVEAWVFDDLNVGILLSRAMIADGSASS